MLALFTILLKLNLCMCVHILSIPQSMQTEVRGQLWGGGPLLSPFRGQCLISDVTLSSSNGWTTRF